MKLNDDMLAILFREFLAPASHRFEPLPVGDEELRQAVEEFREHLRKLADPGREHLIDDDRRFLTVYKRLEADAHRHIEREDARGIYRKFAVSRLDGTSGPGRKHERCRYFVLDLQHDPYSEAALRAYARACRKVRPNLAAEIGQICDALREVGERRGG